MTDTRESLRFYPRRGKMLLLVLVSVTFAAAGMWVGWLGHFVGYLAAGFFGLGAIVLASMLLPNSSYLEVRDDGLTMRSLYRSHSYRWHDIEEFFPISIQGNWMTGLNFTPEFRGHPWGRRLSRTIADCDGAIPEYSVPADKMADILNECLTRFRDATPAG